MGEKNVPKIQRKNIGISMKWREGEKRHEIFLEYSKICNKNSKADDEKEISIKILGNILQSWKKAQVKIKIIHQVWENMTS